MCLPKDVINPDIAAKLGLIYPVDLSSKPTVDSIGSTKVNKTCSTEHRRNTDRLKAWVKKFPILSALPMPEYSSFGCVGILRWCAEQPKRSTRIPLHRDNIQLNLQLNFQLCPLTSYFSDNFLSLNKNNHRNLDPIGAVYVNYANSFWKTGKLCLPPNVSELVASANVGQPVFVRIVSGLTLLLSLTLYGS